MAKRHYSSSQSANNRAGVTNKKKLGRWASYYRTAKWGGVFVLWLALIAGGTIAYFAHDLPDTDYLSGPKTTISVAILDVEGSTIANYGNLWGKVVTAPEMATALSQAVLAIEDRRFFSHSGVDIWGVIRAAWRNAIEGRLVEGGSTITQQVAKLVFLSPEKSLKRKIQEAILAFWLERKFTKQEILTIYLNRAYFGAGTYGVDAAARRYFGTTARELTLPQAAVIAGLLRAPSRFNPVNNLSLAKQRASVVLDAMTYANFLTKEQAISAKQETLNLTILPKADSFAPYFSDWVWEQVPSFVGREHGALRVLTTLDPALQTAAEKAISSTIDRDKEKKNIGEVSLVALDGSGAVRAMVGGQNYSESQFNRATQAKRQPGSAFKTIVYLSAIEEGLRPDTLLNDEPVTISEWSPQNHDSRFRGLMTVGDAFAQSVNTIAVKVGQQVGIRKILETARKLGITSKLPADASLALGTGEVTLIELTTAYATFANEGIGVLPHGIIEIQNRAGDVIYRRAGSGRGAVIDAASASVMQDLLESAVTRGTGRQAILSDGLITSYGKTGTSQQFRDAWFIGWARGLVAGVWMGNDDGSAMNQVTGSSYPAALWKQFMTLALGQSNHTVD